MTERLFIHFWNASKVWNGPFGNPCWPPWRSDAEIERLTVSPLTWVQTT